MKKIIYTFTLGILISWNILAQKESENTIYGTDSGISITKGNKNVFYGYLTGYSNTIGSKNTFVGAGAGLSNITGSKNTFNGCGAGSFNITGNENTFTGYKAGMNNSRGEFNTFIGSRAGYNNTAGNENTFIGYKAGYNNTTGSENTFVGIGAGVNNTSGSKNTFNGYKVGYSNTTGIGNTFNGYQAGAFNTTGEFNTFNGVEAGYANTLGSKNTFIGFGAGSSNSSGEFNTYIGFNSGYSNTTGSKNLCSGFGAGHNNKSGIGNVFLGYKAGFSETNSNKLYIENSDTSIPLIYGEFDNDRIGINRIATTNTLEVGGDASKASAGDWLANSDARLKHNIQKLSSDKVLNQILQLQGITYEWNDDKTGNIRPEGIQYGFTAQNIQEVFPTLVDKDNTGYLQTAYGTYDAMTIEAIRALNNKIIILEKENEALKTQVAKIDQLETMMAELQKQIQKNEVVKSNKSKPSLKKYHVKRSVNQVTRSIFVIVITPTCIP